MDEPMRDPPFPDACHKDNGERRIRWRADQEGS